MKQIKIKLIAEGLNWDDEREDTEDEYTSPRFGLWHRWTFDNPETHGLSFEDKAALVLDVDKLYAHTHLKKTHPKLERSNIEWDTSEWDYWHTTYDDDGDAIEDQRIMINTDGEYFIAESLKQ